MARKKVALRYIADESRRRRTLKTRGENLMKKAEELSILCNAKACVVMYGSKDEAVPEVVFPSHAEAVAMLSRFRDIPADLKRYKKTVDQEGFLEERVEKLLDHGKKSMGVYENCETRSLVHKAVVDGNLSAGINMADLTSVGLKLDLLLKNYSERITKVTGQPPVVQPHQAPYISGGGVDVEVGLATTNHVSEQQQEPETFRSEVDLGGQLYSGDNCSVGTSASASFSGGYMNMMQSSDVGFDWQWRANSGASSSNRFTPM